MLSLVVCLWALAVARYMGLYAGLGFLASGWLVTIVCLLSSELHTQFGYIRILIMASQ